VNRALSRALALALGGALSLAGCDNGFLTQQGYEPPQVIAFSHATHSGEFKMDCQYCHFGAAQSRHAGVPPASLCMGCHAQVKKDSPEVQKLAKAVAESTPIEWTRVHRLPDFVWFSHANHVAAGLLCQKCHGPVETMVRVRQFETMTMGWCLDCHRTTAADPQSRGKLDPPTDCAACHH
jgi:Cytochrome c7 and related cytochrome c